MPLPWAEPFAAALALRHEPGLVLLESMPGFGRLGTRSFLAARPTEVATDGVAAFDRLGDGWWAGWLSYDLGREIERLPDLGRDDLGLPPVLSALAMEPRGLVLVTGPTGSGKTTTLAGMIDHINNNREVHCVTIEDPIEVLHFDKLSMINQREVRLDTADFAVALRAAMRQDPDVILVGEMRDTETVKAALDDGMIGTPALVQIRMLARPPETWHPSPAFLYADLAGPLLDIGPYGIATAVELVGPVRRVTALATRPRESATTIAGVDFPIAEPTRVGAVLLHDGGVLTTLVATFDADGAARHGVEVTGSEGTLVGGDPNTFDGPVVVRRRNEHRLVRRGREPDPAIEHGAEKAGKQPVVARSSVGEVADRSVEERQAQHAPGGSGLDLHSRGGGGIPQSVGQLPSAAAQGLVEPVGPA